MKKKLSAQTDLDDIDFVKARYEYCLELYRNEQGRKEIIERKAQFYLSLVTLFFGALVLKLDFITEIGQLLLTRPASPQITVLYIAGSIFFLSLGSALISVLLSVHVRGYLNEHPVDLIATLFSSAHEYLAANNATELYTSTAKSYALATESDRIINTRKSEWVLRSSLFLIIAFLSFVIVFGIVIFMKLQ